jgi:LysR family hydrogen peroxide-inducible transcriptional activator
MELHQLRYFVAVAETGTFTAAAKRCFVSQPSLSQQILKLEGELGRPLFDRLGRRAELTEGGRRFLGRAQAILSEVEDAARVVRDDGKRGRVRLGVFPSIGPFLLPDILGRARKELPDVDVVISEDFRSYLVEEISAGQLDLLLGSIPPRKVELDVEVLFAEDLLLAMPKGHPLVEVGKIRPKDLVGERLVLLGEASSLGVQTQRFFGAHQINLEVAAQCSQVQTVKALVAAGLGLAIVPWMATAARDDQLVFRAIDGLRARREIVLVRNRHRFRSQAEIAFVDLLRVFCAERFPPAAAEE